MKQFCIAGPVKPDIHYVVPPLGRINYDEIRRLIDGRQCFVLHAPQRTGKASVLYALSDALNKAGRDRALYLKIDGVRAAGGDVGEGLNILLAILSERAETEFGDPFLGQIRAEVNSASPCDALRSALSQWCRQSRPPICLMIDEIDALSDDILLSFLALLRTGYNNRPESFPQSIILCGVRDVRITGGSAFNVKAESIRIGNSPKPTFASSMNNTQPKQGKSLRKASTRWSGS